MRSLIRVCAVSFSLITTPVVAEDTTVVTIAGDGGIYFNRSDSVEAANLLALQQCDYADLNCVSYFTYPTNHEVEFLTTVVCTGDETTPLREQVFEGLGFSGVIVGGPDSPSTKDVEEQAAESVEAAYANAESFAYQRENCSIGDQRQVGNSDYIQSITPISVPEEWFAISLARDTPDGMSAVGTYQGTDTAVGAYCEAGYGVCLDHLLVPASWHVAALRCESKKFVQPANFIRYSDSELSWAIDKAYEEASSQGFAPETECVELFQR